MFAVEYDDGVDGPARVWLGHMDVPGLAMSRSLGDAVAHSAGVSSEPEFFEYEFNKGREDLVLVMASDGLWEFMSDQEVMDIACSTTEPRFAVDRLISESNERWMKEEQVIDDTTVCVAFLGNGKEKVGKKSCGSAGHDWTDWANYSPLSPSPSPSPRNNSTDFDLYSPFSSPPSFSAQPIPRCCSNLTYHHRCLLTLPPYNLLSLSPTQWAGPPNASGK